MRLPLLLLLLTIFAFNTDAQRRRPAAAAATRAPESGQAAIVGDEMLSVLRARPSLFAESKQRMSRGRRVQILGRAEADGVTFYRVSAPPAGVGWIQADAVFAKFRAADEERFARLVQASDGFDQIELAAGFFEMYPNSRFRPPLLLLFGDMLEATAVKLSRDAGNRLSRREMAASAAPMHSYFLNFVSLDRYRKLGITFLFNSSTRQFHYDGASWKEIVERFGGSGQAAEARKRLDDLKIKMERKAAG